MSCHENHNENGKDHKHSPGKHMLHMILCCGIPVVIIFLLPYIAKYNTGAAGLLGLIAPLICPIMMGGMMFMMFRSNKKTSAVNETNPQLEKTEEQK